MATTLAFDEKLAHVKEAVNSTTDYYQGHTDMVFIRFLRGQKENVDNAVKALLATAEFRKETRADSLTVDDCRAYHDRRVTFIDGFDKEQLPVLNCLCHRHSPQERDIEEVKNFIIYVIDKALKMSKPDVEKLAIIFDLTQFSMKIMDFECTKVFVTILQTHYPEILGQAYIVNAPFIFRACWAVIRPWLDPVTAAKVQFIRADQLTNFIEFDQISEEVRTNCKLTSSGKARSETITPQPEVLTETPPVTLVEAQVEGEAIMPEKEVVAETMAAEAVETA
jgi:hypothetical protein